MPRRGRWLANVALTVLAPALAVLGIRGINACRYPEPLIEMVDLDAVAGVTDTPTGVRVERIASGRLDGFHLRPAGSVLAGLVVTWGGSDGGGNDALALGLANSGHEVLALHYFGRPNQPAILSAVPLEFFGEALDYAAAHAASTHPLTVIGSSKGAELALLLPSYYAEIDNVVAFTPSEFVYQGLDYSSPHSSWTWQGRELPYVGFQHAAPEATLGMLAAKALNLPVRLRETYATAADRDPHAHLARIDVTRIRGHLLAFAGDDDRMWQGEIAAGNLAAARPELTEVRIYPGAGHAFWVPGWYAAGYELGGSAEANAAALAGSTALLHRRMAQWHREPGGRAR